MSSDSSSAQALPDVAHVAQPHLDGLLDWVGMNHIEVPVLIAQGPGEAPLRVSARVDAHVNLENREARGIHMSRLYLAAEASLAHEPLTPASLEALLRQFLSSHAGLASRARVRIRYDQLLRRPALKSHHSGWRAYPVTVTGYLAGDDFTAEVATEVIYSSTCPASAALSRQLISEQFARDFSPDAPLDHEAIVKWLQSERGMIATPHAQRSVAKVRVHPAPALIFDTVGLIESVENALGTPVQTAVKREDEQAFAKANGGNLLFCEDAARRIQRSLNADTRIADFALRVSHEESLHPHDAVAYASKGVPGGYDGLDAFAGD